MNQLPEFRNPLVILGNQVVFGQIPASKAVQSIGTDQQFQGLPDEQLEAWIRETDEYWRHDLDIAVHHPENVAIYPILMAASAQERLRAIGRFRAGQGEEGKHQLDERMDHWLTLAANCLLARGMALLLLPDSEGAWHTFAEAANAANALPDLDRPRWRELLWAVYGQGIAALQGEQQELSEQAEQLLNRLVAQGGEQASDFLAEIQVEFNHFASLYRQRLGYLNASQSGQTTQTAPEEPEDEETRNRIAYTNALTELARQVLEGKLELEAACAQILARAGELKPTPWIVHFLSVSHQNLRYSQPDMAFTLASLNYAVAGGLKGDLAENTRLYCAFALGTILVAQARYHENEAAFFQQAIPYLEEAQAYFDTQDNQEDRLNSGYALNHLALCYRGIGDFPRAVATNRRSIQVWESLGANLSELGAAHGNLGDNLEQTGDLNAAFEEHYQALQLFVQEQDLRLARMALQNLTSLALLVGRIDDAVAALEKINTLTAQVADAADAVQACLSLGENLFTTGHHEQALRVFDQAETLLAPLLEEEQPERRSLEQSVDLQIWKGTLFTLLLDVPTGQFTLEMAHDILEEARVQAYQLMDERLFAKAVLQLMTLHYHVRQPQMVAEYDGMLTLIRLTPAETARREEIVGIDALLQGDYDKAVEHLKKALEIYPPEQLIRKIVAWDRIGQAYEGLGNLRDAMDAYEQAVAGYNRSREAIYEASRIEFMSNAAEIYARLVWLNAHPGIDDPTRALLWLEQSKSQTFEEMIGLAQLSMPNPPAEIHELLAQEQEQLGKLNAIRSQLFLQSNAETDNLALQQELRNSQIALNALWDQIGAVRPEYVALRRGSNLSWEEIQELVD